jgi:hypothetical protein
MPSLEEGETDNEAQGREATQVVVMVAAGGTIEV